MASLGSLVIELAASTARLQSDLGKAVSMAQGAAARFTRIFGGVATLAGAGSLGAVVARTIEMGDELNKAAIKAGTTGRAMSELAFAAKQSDIDLSSLSTALKKMQVALSEAAAGGKSQIKSLADLGLSVKQIRDLKPDQQFELIADRISEIRDPADRARAATELFGKAGADLLPMFEQGAAGIRKAREEAQKLGASFSDEQLKRLAAADDAVKRMKASWEGFATSLTSKVAPAISFTLGLLHGDLPKAEIGSQIANIVYQINALEGTKTERGLKKLEELRAKLKQLGEQSRAARGGRGTGGNAPQERTEDPAPNKSLLAAAKRAQDEYYENLRRQAQITGREFDDLLHKRAQEMDFQREIVDGLGTEEDARVSLAELASASAEEASKSLTKMAEDAQQAAEDSHAAWSDVFFAALDGGMDDLAKRWQRTLKWMVAEAAASGILSMFKGTGFLSSFTSSLSGSLSGIGKLFGGGKAQGGPLNPGKWYIAGEKGPEPIWGGGAGAFASGYGKGGQTVVIKNHIDARGADPSFIARMPQILKSNNEALKADILNGLRRGLYA